MIVNLSSRGLIQVTVTLATLSFFCRRPMIVAIMEFVDAITVEDDTCESFSNSSSAATARLEISTEEGVHNQLATNDEPTVKGLLGKGKSRVMFFLALNMAHAQILLMKEDGTRLATLSQDNFLTDIKVWNPLSLVKALQESQNPCKEKACILIIIIKQLAEI